MQHTPLQLLAVVSILIFSLVGTAVGVRLLLLARRTRELPELALGLCLVMIATLGYPLSLASVAFEGSSVGVRLAFYLATAGTVDLGILGVLVFVQRVFRPQAAAARAAVWGGALALLAVMVANVQAILSTPDAAAYAEAAQPISVVFFSVAAAAFGWSAVEATAWHLRLHRRLALGLADPVVVDRFRLWALWGASTTLGSVVNLVFTGAGETIHDPVPLLATAVFGWVNAGALGLAFFAPAWYRERVVRSSG